MTTPHPHHELAHRPAIALPFGPVAAPGIRVFSGDGYLIGWGLLETTGAAAALLDVLDGQDATGVEIAPVALQAGQSVRDNFGGRAHLFRNGLFVAVTSGTVRGALWVVSI